jgi:hypothetical protein
MRTAVCIALSSIASISPAAAWGQAVTLPPTDSTVMVADRGHAHVLHVTDAFASAPGGQALLRIALAEGEIATLHAELAVEAINGVEDVRLHVAHMLHALDPAVVFEGPGLGYGMRRATEEALLHVEMAAESAGASESLRIHASHVAASLRGALDRAEAMVELARDVQRATSSAAAAPLLGRLSELGAGLVAGRDLDGDGLVGWQNGEGGLRQAGQHMTLLKRGEGLLARP